MAEMIVRPNIGAVCLIIALFSIGGLQPIDCEEDHTLLKTLRTKSCFEVESLLEAVDDQDNVELAGFSVSRLLSLRHTSEVNCGRKHLAEDYSLVELCSRKNQGLYKFTKHYFDIRAKWCFEKLVDNVKIDVEKKVDASDRQVVEAFWTKFVEDKFDLSEFQIDNEKVEHMKKIVKRLRRRFTDKEKEKVESSCTELNDVVKPHLPGLTWYEYQEWLQKEKVQFGWIKRGMVCLVYLTLLKRRKGNLFPIYHVDKTASHYSTEYLGYGLDWIIIHRSIY